MDEKAGATRSLALFCPYFNSAASGIAPLQGDGAVILLLLMKTNKIDLDIQSDRSTIFVALDVANSGSLSYCRSFL